MKKTIIFLIASMVFSSVFAINFEPQIIEGAYFTVRGKPDAKISIFTHERTMADVTSVFEDRWWKTGVFNYQSKTADEELKVPRILLGLQFYQLKFGADITYDVHSDGEILAVVSDKKESGIESTMEKLGFKRLDVKPFRFLGMDKKESLTLYSKKVKKGEVLKNVKPYVIYAGLNMKKYTRSGETLYNNIVIPREWPPDYNVGDKRYDPSKNEPMPVPYLEKKPAVINISVGRQLFVDDFLLDKSTKDNFVREFHYPKKYKGNPVLKPETELENGKPTPWPGNPTAPAAVPSSGGLWWNEELGVYQVWYNASWHGTLAYATSKDGNTWERPNLNIFAPTNQIMPDNAFVDSGANFYDPYEPDTTRKYKQMSVGGINNFHARMWYSKDGVTLDYPNHFSAGIAGERTTVFYNPFRKKWVYSLRWHTYWRSHRCYAEGDEFIRDSYWFPKEVVYWLAPDKNDKPVKKWSPNPAIYNVDSIAYESLIISFLDFWYGPENTESYYAHRPKHTAIKLAYSRDGFHFSRPDYKHLIEWDHSSWDRGYVQGINGGITIHGDKMRIWYVGCTGGMGPAPDKNKKFEVKDMLLSRGMHGNYSLGYATMRRDGFVSLNTKGEKTAEILTEPLQFAGSYLFVNVDAPKGAISAQIEDMEGKVIQPFSFENCNAVKGDTTRKEITWNGAKSLGKLSYKPVRIRFKLENGKFYSFWVSVAKNGRSDGYLGAGMPGCATPIDTVGDGS